MAASPDLARRVALLARPGEAFERLRAVLDQAGAQCVLAADPTQLDPAKLLDVQPQVVLVALDAQTEDALQNFDAVLGDPSIDVIYEEAELIAAREGWAVARWQRHLVAKVHGHADVLPPGREPDPVSDPRGLPGNAAAALPASVDPIDAEPALHGGAATDSMADFAAAPADAPTEAASAPATFEFDALLDSVSFEPSAAPSVDLEPDLAGIDLAAIDPASEFDLPGDDDATTGVGEFAFNAFDPVTAEHDAVGLAAAESSPDDIESAAAFGELSLEPVMAEPDAADDDESTDRFHRDLGDLQARIATLELVDDTPPRGPETARGAVLVLSGIGGPDAVRQLLGALPKGFARPVLIQQRLDGGRYDKLVTQLQRASVLPVELAVAEQPALAGIVYILPAAIGLAAGSDGLRFRHDPDECVLGALPSADSAVLLLSGSDPAQLDALMTHSWAGALVAGQAADGCYDATAPNALAARGGVTASPQGLASRLAERWQPTGIEDVQV